MNYTSTMQFIDLFRRSRALWDRNDVDYLNKEARQRQREMIGYTMGMTEVDVGKKISNLRTYYIREMVKRDKAIMQGQITPETYVPRWPYYDALDVFLGDVVRKKRNEALVASGMAPELHFMYVEEHHSDSDNDHDDLAKLDDNDLSRDSAGSSGGGTATITSTATTTGGDGGKDGGEGPPIKRPKLEPGTVPEQGHGVVSDSNRPLPHSAASSGPQYGTHFTSSPMFQHSPATSPSVRVVAGRGSWAGATPGFLGHNPVAIGGAGGGALPGGGIPNPGSAVHDLGSGGGPGFAGGASATSVPPGMVLVEEDDDWLFGRYLVRELKKVMSFKDKQLAKMKMTQIVTYAQLGMNEPTSSDADVTNS